MATTLVQDMNAACEALAVFDVDRLEAIEEKIRKVTAEHLLLSLAQGEEELPQLLQTHTLLGQMVEVTAANLKVLASVFQATRCAEGV